MGMVLLYTLILCMVSLPTSLPRHLLVETADKGGDDYSNHVGFPRPPPFYDYAWKNRIKDRIIDVDVDLDITVDQHQHHLHLHHHLQALFGVKTEPRPTCNTYRFQKYKRVGNIVFKKKIKKKKKKNFEKKKKKKKKKKKS